jgi:uncharacterized protein DUF6084
VSVGAQTDPRAGAQPRPEFAITSAAHLPYAAAPTMVFSATATDEGEYDIQSMALSVQVMIDPSRRGYDPETRERLAELFGPPASWTPSTQSLSWARITAVVPGFVGETTFALELPCTYDLEVAATKFFYALAGGEVPLSFHFSGTVFYRAGNLRLQVAPVPWSATARFQMPVASWRAMIAEHYPGGGWIRLKDETLDALNTRRAQRGLPTLDACVAGLLEESRGAG